MKYITKYITKISGTGAGMRGLHLIGSWGNSVSKKMRMICKECGCYFHPLWDLGYVTEEYVDFEYAEVDYGKCKKSIRKYQKNIRKYQKDIRTY